MKTSLRKEGALVVAEQKAGQADEAFIGLPFVTSTYLAFGQPGIERLSQDLRRKGHSPLLDAFTTELYEVLSGARPVPTDLINEALREAEVDVAYTRRGLLAELNTLWEQLDLQTVDDATADQDETDSNGHRSTLLWVRGDPVQALRTWMSWKLLAMLALGVVMTATSWTEYHSTHGIIKFLTAATTLIGFLVGGSAGALLMLRRNGYQNPDAENVVPTFPGPFRRRR